MSNATLFAVVASFYASCLQEYRVTLPQPPTQQQLQLLKAGTTIEGVHVVPKRVQLLQPPSVANGAAQQVPARRSSTSSSSSNTAVRGRPDGRCVLCIEVSEGKKHEVSCLQRFG
jgi:16S rRNA U516 pseudouridylate synthase RsuA-like enzyme